MSLNQQSSTIDNNAGQSIGCDPKSRRNSGLFSFFKWFKPSSSSRESIDAIDQQISRSNSCDSLNSTHSAGTVASFSFVPPSAYKKCVSEKCIAPGPETDTYKARIKQRDKRRECDKNLTLRKKYNLFFNKDTLLKSKTPEIDEENTKSLPLMTRPVMEAEQDVKVHRRTNSESSKVKKAGAYLHVKGKRRAPQPPGLNGTSTASLRRKKRVAPAPPVVKSEIIADILCNDSLKLDHGILKSAKETEIKAENSSAIASNSATSSRSSYVEAPVSPRPWYKRNTARESAYSKKEKIDHKYEHIEVPEVPYKRNSTLDLTTEEAKLEKKKEEKRKSGLSFLTNISELDREASEIIKNKELEKNGFGDIPEMPEFMRPKDTKINTDSWVSPKRRSAKDLIAKFNAITSVTKVTVFGAAPKDARLFGKQTSLDETKQRQQALLESHKKKIEEIDKKNLPLMKSESASAIKVKPETPKMEKKSWKCPKCNLENEYWRIICHVCSAIKPYFDDFSSSPKAENRLELKTSSPLALKRDSPPKKPELNLERSKTQIGFSALASYNAINKSKHLEKTSAAEDKSQKEVNTKKEEKEKLKKMLIEMKNSLPKRKSNVMLKQNNRASVIVENPEHLEEVKEPVVNAETDELVQTPEEKEKTEEPKTPEKSQEEKVAEILIGTTQTIYENIKIKKTDIPKPVKVSSSAQTSGVVKQVVPPSTVSKILGDQPKRSNGYEQYELMRPKDFEDIYTDSNSKSAAKIYANLARNDELSLFFNMPKNFNNIKNEAKSVNNTDTIEINRLLKRLETSIAKGELVEAAIFAKELAQLKVNCSVIRQKPSPPRIVGKRKGIQIEMYVEDKVSHRGPFPIEVDPGQTVADLKQQVARDFEIPEEYQRWILGKELVVDESSTLKHHGITNEKCPVFLYLVAPDPKKKVEKPKTPIDKEAPSTSKIQNQLTEATAKEQQQPIAAKIAPENEFEKVKTNVQNLQNILRESKGKEPMIQTSKTDHSPKIVNVIPKASEIKSKPDVRIIPIQIEKSEPKSILKPEPTVAIKEVITIEEKPVAYETKVSKAVAVTDLNDTQTPLKILTSQEVIPKIQYVFPTIQNSYQSNSVNEKSDSPSTKETQLQKEEPQTSQKGENQIKQTPLQDQASSSQLTKPTKEDDEEYDTNTLKPAKEWECHLCTLLNPITSNVCAVCATVRIHKEPLKRHVKKKAPQPKPKNDQTYLQLMDLDNADLVENVEPFECVICFLEIPERDGVTLRECLHQFCKACLAHTIEFNDEAEVKCPYRDEVYSCNIALQDREIKALVTPVVYEQHLAKSVAQAENKIDKSFHCKTPDCKGWCIFEDNVNEFRCPVCRRNNCLTCQAIHMGMNCREYQEKMNDESAIDDDARRTRDMLEEMVKNGEAIECPTCRVILMKKWGCDWLRCSMCKTEICWVTRGPRWGPAGKGDTSGGCQCGLNGIKCHPKCNYCH